jgi:hypothetical protein
MSARARSIGPGSISMRRVAVEGRRGVRAEVAGQLDGFVQDHRGGRVGAREFVAGEPQDVAVDSRHPRDPPVLGVGRYQRVDFRCAVDGAADQRLGEGVGTGGKIEVRRDCFEDLLVGGRRTRTCALGQVDRVEDLQSDPAQLVTGRGPSAAQLAFPSESGPSPPGLSPGGSEN